MASLDLADVKEGIFARPKTIKAIVGTKTEIPVHNLGELLEAIQGRTEREAIVIEDFALTPPHFLSAQHYAKRGDFVWLNTFDGNEHRLRENEWSELKARIQAEKRVKRLSKPFVGWMWEDPERILHMMRPTITVQGRWIEHYSRVSEKIGEKIHLKNVYQGKTWDTIIAQVPSRTSDPHDVVLQHIPQVNGYAKYVEWTRLSSDHRCAFKRGDINFRGVRTERLCPHDVAAFVAHSRRVYEETGRMIPQVAPLFTEPILRAFMGLAYHTLIFEEYQDEAGKTRHRSRPLRLVEIDRALMEAWRLHGNKQTFFVRGPSQVYKTGPPVGERKSMQNYNWSINAPGLPFGKD